MDHRALQLAIILLLAACGAPEAPPATIEFHDSAAVAIVLNPGLHLADSTAWTIDSVPAQRIGLVDGPAEYIIGRLAGLHARPFTPQPGSQHGALRALEAAARQ